MKILSADQIREADAYTITHEPIRSVDLMERAAGKCAEWIENRFEKDFLFTIFCGTGNNGGDGLVIARKLFGSGFKVEVIIVRFSEKCTEDFLINEKRISDLKIPVINLNESSFNEFNLYAGKGNKIIIDAIFGSGLSRPVAGFAADIIKMINRSQLKIISVDIPSGLFCDDNTGNTRDCIVRATHTLSFELPKLAFLFAGNSEFTGEWHILPIGLHQDFINGIPCHKFFLTKHSIAGLIKSRKKFSHKGNFGHALLFSGSRGMIGASVLVSKACLRSGAGLVTSHIPRCGYEIVQTAVPEAIISTDESESQLSSLPELHLYNAIGIGPGIRTSSKTTRLLKLLIQNAACPVVFDADAINILSENKTWLSFIPGNSIFTPHPKEFERLAGKTKNDTDTLNAAIQFAKKFSCYVVLKGAHTSISCPDGNVYFNSTGNPGMAKAGSGDVLTGILTGLLARGYNPKTACLLGVFLHGLAGDLAADNIGREAIIASDIIDFLGKSYIELSELNKIMS